MEPAEIANENQRNPPNQAGQPQLANFKLCRNWRETEQGIEMQIIPENIPDEFYRFKLYGRTWIYNKQRDFNIEFYVKHLTACTEVEDSPVFEKDLLLDIPLCLPEVSGSYFYVMKKEIANKMVAQLVFDSLYPWSTTDMKDLWFTVPLSNGQILQIQDVTHQYDPRLRRKILFFSDSEESVIESHVFIEYSLSLTPSSRRIVKPDPTDEEVNQQGNSKDTAKIRNEELHEPTDDEGLMAAIPESSPAALPPGQEVGSQVHLVTQNEEGEDVEVPEQIPMDLPHLYDDNELSEIDLKMLNHPPPKADLPIGDVEVPKGIPTVGQEEAPGPVEPFTPPKKNQTKKATYLNQQTMSRKRKIPVETESSVRGPAKKVKPIANNASSARISAISTPKYRPINVKKNVNISEQAGNREPETPEKAPAEIEQINPGDKVNATPDKSCSGPKEINHDWAKASSQRRSTRALKTPARYVMEKGSDEGSSDDDEENGKSSGDEIKKKSISRKHPLSKWEQDDSDNFDEEDPSSEDDEDNFSDEELMKKILKKPRGKRGRPPKNNKTPKVGGKKKMEFSTPAQDDADTEIEDFNEEAEVEGKENGEKDDGRFEKSLLKLNIIMREPELVERVCPVEGCERGGYTDVELLRHHLWMNHRGNFKCRECPRKFDQPAHLLSHWDRHSGLKPFACHECDKKYARKYDLKTHLLVHAGIKSRDTSNLTKKFQCKHCEYKCTNIRLLNRHMLVHTGEKPYACHLCPKACTTAFNLKKHMQKHSAINPYECEVCKDTFGYQQTLKNHMRRFHPEHLP